mmetsp:Transcript_45941/g.108354  ORF Transcript_45941/g.108354 Transcript_45941/m.108354 type:complete len:100 (+) Transcript_45941:160-459(+)
MGRSKEDMCSTLTPQLEARQESASFQMNAFAKELSSGGFGRMETVRGQSAWFLKGTLTLEASFITTERLVSGGTHKEQAADIFHERKCTEKLLRSLSTR